MTVVENVFAPEAYAGDAPFFLRTSGNIIISFESARIDMSLVGEAPYPVRRVIVGRLIMPAAGALAVANGLCDFLISQGMEPARNSQKQN